MGFSVRAGIADASEIHAFILWLVGSWRFADQVVDRANV